MRSLIKSFGISSCRIILDRRRVIGRAIVATALALVAGAAPSARAADSSIDDRVPPPIAELLARIVAEQTPRGDGGIAVVNCPVACTGPLPWNQENEPCGTNTVNCGCDCAQQIFLQLRCPEGYCGSVWAFQGQHDTDWYNVHVNDSNNDGTEQICFTVNADFPAVVEIYTGNCGGLTMVAQGEASDCNPLTLCACIPAPNFAKLRIYPGTIAGGPMNSGLPCPTTNHYTIRYNCAGVCNQGACCYQVPPICAVMTQQQCAQLPSSTWYGVGSSCTPNLCQTGAPTGACCYQIPGLPGFQCTVTTQTDCVNNLHGMYQGNGVPCTAATCAAQTGACCYLDAAGVMQCIVTTQQDCEHSYFGTYYGNGSSCATVNCQPLTGACCYQNTTGTGFQCGIMTQAQCQNIGGTYYGNGSVCSPSPCDPTGACCYQVAGAPWQCVQTTAANCATLPNGVYWGNGTLCANVQCNPAPVDGACCYQIPGTTIWQCIITTQADCINNYFNSTWGGPNSTCNSVTCPQQTVTGACCYRNPPPSTTHSCIVTTQQDCVTNYPGGVYQGNGTTCAQVQCDPPKNGACCWQDLPNPTVFCTVTTQLDCMQNYPNSSWLGPNTTCNPNPCIPTGACCYEAPDGFHCIITTQANCATLPNSTYHGNGSSCNPDPCEPKGACCYLDATGFHCAIVTQIDCISHFTNGVWQGPNTTCNPNPCEPTGACCYQQADNLPYSCTVVTQQQCATLANSIWYGPNTTCASVQCPITGACCYTVPGVVGTLCAMTTQQQCVQALHGTYMGNNVQCTSNPCPNCTTPPKGMVTWWMLDEIAGGIAHDSASGLNGGWSPTPATGPTPTAGYVDGALRFDGANDLVRVPHSPIIDFNCKAFSIDAWINPQSYGGVIVRKSNAAAKGYEFFLAQSGQLGLGLGDGSVVCAPFLSTGIVPLNTWTHVAVTASGGPPTRTISFYINGAASGSSVTGNCICVGNNASLLIGGAGNFAGYWRGMLDEIEMFKRVIGQAEVQSVYNAGTKGKCKTRVHVPWDTPFCLNQNQVTVPVTICNDSPFPYSYNVSFQPLNTCTIPGPTVFTPLFSNPVGIGPNSCVTVQVKINRPVGMNAVYQIACYQVSVQNTTTGFISFGQGSVQDRRDLCAMIGPCCIGTDVALPVGTTANMSFNLTNTSPVPLNIPYMIKGMDSDDMSTSPDLRLNGLPPGTRYIGNLTLQPSGGAIINFTCQYIEHHALGFNDIVLSTDTDGDGTFEPLISIGLHSVPAHCDADVAPQPVGNGIVDIDDLVAVITHWGNCPIPCVPGTCVGDTNHDCVVNIDDLVKVITTWGDCQQ